MLPPLGRKDSRGCGHCEREIVFRSDSSAPAASGLCEEQRLSCKTPVTWIIIIIIIILISIIMVSSAVGLLGMIDDSARTKTSGIKNVCTSAMNSVHKVCSQPEFSWARANELLRQVISNQSCNGFASNPHKAGNTTW